MYPELAVTVPGRAVRPAINEQTDCQKVDKQPGRDSREARTRAQQSETLDNETQRSWLNQ